MEIEKKEKTALFRFGIIHQLIGLKDNERGKKEALLEEITSKNWNIPFSGRSYIGRSTILKWEKRYMDSGEKLESLYPDDRNDMGKFRALEEETEQALINLKKEKKEASLPTILRIAKENKLLPVDFKASSQTIYRLFQKYELNEKVSIKDDLRKFEAELPNDIWQSDCMHGPGVIVEGKVRKSYLIAFIDDHSRLIPHAEFCLNENLDNYLTCLKKALNKRGLPRKLYVDNGPAFSAHHLEHVTASLGIALVHARPYRPQGKGKIERWFRTIRMQFLPLLKKDIAFKEINKKLSEWINNEYHLRKHSSTGEAPFDRYTKHLHLVRAVPERLNDYFRKKTTRKVNNDRTISLLGKCYEAPVALIGRSANLLYHPDDLSHIEIFYKEKSYGLLVPTNLHINSRIKRDQHYIDIVPDENNQKDYAGGNLF